MLQNFIDEINNVFDEKEQTEIEHSNDQVKSKKKN